MSITKTTSTMQQQDLLMAIIHYLIFDDILFGRTDEYPPSVYVQALEKHFAPDVFWRALRHIQEEGLIDALEEIDLRQVNENSYNAELAVFLTARGVAELVEVGEFDEQFAACVSDVVEDYDDLSDEEKRLDAVDDAFASWVQANWTFSLPTWSHVGGLDGNGIDA